MVREQHEWSSRITAVRKKYVFIPLDSIEKTVLVLKRSKGSWIYEG